MDRERKKEMVRFVAFLVSGSDNGVRDRTALRSTAAKRGRWVRSTNPGIKVAASGNRHGHA